MIRYKSFCFTVVVTTHTMAVMPVHSTEKLIFGWPIAALFSEEFRTAQIKFSYLLHSIAEKKKD